MKKILVTTVLASALVGSAFGQGTIAATSSGGKVKYTTDGTTLISLSAGSGATVSTYGAFNYAIYTAPAGTVLTYNADGTIPAAWTESQTVGHNIGPIAGALLNTTITTALNVAPGSSVQATLVAWTGNFADFNSARLDGTGLYGWTGSALSGGALSWLQGTGNPTTSPPGTPTSIVAGAAGFNGLVLQTVPEPGTLALAGLGAASLLLFRRRK